ncbi:hypothetical protein EC973_007575 [Apophysomyces ossiformis]|uniref:Uncharacterized protein n=1 Tax=Apophysomyces ossiformis TaxID=679940 RepID=A0A8H7BRQ7_9FUNG|nr:hypothetical protein EC973_007575 [Apophysomyces ossiformis]
MSTNYFFRTEPSQWQLKDAIDEIELDRPAQPLRTTFGDLKKSLKEVTEKGNETQATAALRLLESWKKIKKEFKKGNRQASMSITADVYVNTGAGSNVTVYNQLPGVKRQETCSDSVTQSWNSREEKRRKIKHVYLSSYYGTDSLESASEWIVNEADVSDLLRDYRSKSVSGAQSRKHLSPARVLSLSFIFLLSPTRKCALTGVPSRTKSAILREAINSAGQIDFIDDATLLSCRAVQRAMTFGEEEVKEQIARLALDASRPGKICATILNDMGRLLYTNQPRRLLRKGNNSNGRLECDLVKLGKELLIALNKLVDYGIDDPEVYGLLVEEEDEATVFKLDIQHDGIYRMVELSKMSVLWKFEDHVMLLPSIVEKLLHVQRLISAQIEKFTMATNLKRPGVHRSSKQATFVRVPCRTPVAVKH